MESILNSIKKLLGIPSDYEQFDTDIIMHINATFPTLRQLGVGPSTGFRIEDETSTWADYLGDTFAYEDVKTYIYLQVKLIFDPPPSSAVIQAYNERVKELTWRLNVTAESEELLN